MTIPNRIRLQVPRVAAAFTALLIVVFFVWFSSILHMFIAFIGIALLGAFILINYANRKGVPVVFLWSVIFRPAALWGEEPTIIKTQLGSKPFAVIKSRTPDMTLKELRENHSYLYNAGVKRVFYSQEGRDIYATYILDRQNMPGLVVGSRLGGDFARVDLVNGPHIAVQGMTRSGKSVFIYRLLLELTTSGIPFKVAGVDLSGALLNPWRDISESRYLAIADDSKVAAKVLNELVLEMEARIKYLLLNQIDKLGEPSKEYPLLLIVLDEYLGTLSKAQSEDREAYKQISLAVNRLVLEGHKVNFRVLVSGQKLLSNLIGSELRANLGNRLTFKVDAPEAVKLLHPKVDAVEVCTAMESWRPGTALVEVGGFPAETGFINGVTYSEYCHGVRMYAQNLQ